MTSGTCVEMACQVNGNIDVPSQTLSAEGISFSDKNYNGYGSSGFVTGWMYTNEQGQMCGPYIQDQLLEGLSTGYLPDDLPVYPVINGALLNPVLLKFFKLYPDHIATGFVHLHIPVKDSSVNCTLVSPNSVQQVHVSSNSYSYDKTSDLNQPLGITVQHKQSLSWEERCWLFEDGYGTTQGPHTLSELYYWHQCGYLHGSVLIRHTENKFSPFTFVSLINTWSQRGMSVSSGTADSMEFISEISEVIGSELHNGIMKAARRFVLDEIIGNTIVEFAAMKKAQKQSKNENGIENAKTCSDDSGKLKDNAGARHGTTSQNAAIKHDNISSMTCSPNRSLAEVSAPQYIRSVGSVVNFKEAIMAVKHALFDGCEPVLWNEVVYDYVTAHVLTWRKRKRWTYSSMVGSTAHTDSHKVAEEQSGLVETCSSSYELDCPPGFHPTIQSLSSIPPSPHREPTHALSCAQRYDCDQEEIISSVQNELFIAAKTAMVDLLRESAEEEAYSFIKSLKDSETDKTDAGTSGEHTVSEMAQGVNSIPISIDDLELPMQESKQSNPIYVFSRKRSRYDFLGSGFKRLGAPVGPAIDYERTDEPPPPGLAASKVDSCDWQSLMQLPGSQILLEGTRSVRENCYDFVGSAFRQLGKPIFPVVYDQRIDDTPPPGTENGITNSVALVNSCKARLSGSSEGILKCKKFVTLAMCRQELHDVVLREWKSSFEDNLLSQLLSSCFSPKKQCRHHQPENEDIMERSRSSHNSGPSEVSVADKFTYSGKKKPQRRLRAEPDSPTLGDMKQLNRQSLNKIGKQKDLTNVSGRGTSGVRNVKPKENGVYRKPTESDTGTSKRGTLNKRKLSSENQPLTRSSGTNKLPKLTGTSRGKASVGNGSIAVEKVKDVEVIPNDTREHSGRNLCHSASQDEADIQSQVMQKASENKKLKRKHLTNESSAHTTKDTHLMIANTIQSPCKKGSNKSVSKSKSKAPSCYPVSVGCARTSINGWDWHKWSLNARPAERARVRGIQITTLQRLSADICVPVASHVKGISARTNRVKMRNLLAAAEGAELLKASQLKARKKRLRFQRSKIHDWGLVALEPIEMDDFVIEYVGELIRPRISDIREVQYEKMGIGSSYLFRLDDGYVVDATKRGGIARFINHSCEPNCYTKIVPVEGQKRIFIYAKRHISAGEEITYDYKFPLEEKKIPCNCGSKRCRGSMN